MLQRAERRSDSVPSIRYAQLSVCKARRVALHFKRTERKTAFQGADLHFNHQAALKNATSISEKRDAIAIVRGAIPP